jgi:hypothetical protein
LAPLPIAREGLFKLDVDDDIWQDIGLDDDGNDMQQVVPAWLGNDSLLVLSQLFRIVIHSDHY